MYCSFCLYWRLYSSHWKCLSFYHFPQMTVFHSLPRVYRTIFVLCTLCPLPQVLNFFFLNMATLYKCGTMCSHHIWPCSTGDNPSFLGGYTLGFRGLKRHVEIVWVKEETSERHCTATWKCSPSFQPKWFHEEPTAMVYWVKAPECSLHVHFLLYLHRRTLQ